MTGKWKKENSGSERSFADDWKIFLRAADASCWLLPRGNLSPNLKAGKSKTSGAKLKKPDQLGLLPIPARYRRAARSCTSAPVPRGSRQIWLGPHSTRAPR